MQADDHRCGWRTGDTADPAIEAKAGPGATFARVHRLRIAGSGSRPSERSRFRASLRPDERPARFATGSSLRQLIACCLWAPRQTGQRPALLPLSAITLRTLRRHVVERAVEPIAIIPGQSREFDGIHPAGPTSKGRNRCTSRTPVSAMTRCSQPRLCRIIDRLSEPPPPAEFTDHQLTCR